MRKLVKYFMIAMAVCIIWSCPVMAEEVTTELETVYSHTTTKSNGMYKVQYIDINNVIHTEYYDKNGNEITADEYKAGITEEESKAAAEKKAKEEATAKKYFVYNYEKDKLLYYTKNEYEQLNRKQTINYFTKKKINRVKVKKTFGEFHKKKYLKGYNLSWNKIKKAKGYQVKIYRYSALNKKYVCIQTKNIKRNKYFLSDLRQGETYKYTIQAYKDVKGKKSYSRCSKKFKLKIKVKKSQMFANYVTKKFTNKYGYDRFESEKAFIKQNKVRRKVGVKELIWSEKMYDVGKIRTKEMSILGEVAHRRPDGRSDIVTYEEYFGDFYRRVNSEKGTDGYYDGPLPFTENAAGGPYTSEIVGNWVASSGHYHTMIEKQLISGAIVEYIDSKRAYWIADFSIVDVDKEIIK